MHTVIFLNKCFGQTVCGYRKYRQKVKWRLFSSTNTVTALIEVIQHTLKRFYKPEDYSFDIMWRGSRWTSSNWPKMGKWPRNTQNTCGFISADSLYMCLLWVTVHLPVISDRTTRGTKARHVPILHGKSELYHNKSQIRISINLKEVENQSNDVPVNLQIYRTVC